MNLQSFNAAIQAGQFPLEFPGHWLAGQWKQDKRGQSINGSSNPSRGTKLIDVNISVPLIHEAIGSAEAAQQTLAAMSLDERLQILYKFKSVVADFQEEIIRVLRVEAGKPQWEAKADFDSTFQKLEDVLHAKEQIHTALVAPFGIATRLDGIRLQPVGVTMAFLPFSTPFATMAQTFAAAMISGCPIVVMSSSHATLAGILFSLMFEKIEELPHGAVNMLFGNYKSFIKALQDKRIKAVIYSGSREHCDAIRAENVNNLTRQLILQSGGKNSVIVDESADLSEAVRCSLFGVIKAAGQLNSSTSRIFVPKSMLSEFTDQMEHAVREMQIGPTDGDSDPLMGPLYSQKAVDKFLRFQTMAKRESAETLVWGKALDCGSDGHFVSPGLHVFAEFDPDSSYQSNVFMCPDMVVYPYERMEDAVCWANSTSAPYVTALLGAEEAFQPYLPSLISPNILHNLPTVGVDLLLPVAGRNLCGGHRLNGVGIAMLLTYPQALQGSGELRERFKLWPSLPS
ncbi:MAG: aldehyde dehydrogenase family protein [Oligoflexus sp.]